MSKILAALAKQEEADLVILGKQAIGKQRTYKENAFNSNKVVQYNACLLQLQGATRILPQDDVNSVLGTKGKRQNLKESQQEFSLILV